MMALDFNLVLLLALIIVTSSSIITITHTEAFAGKSLPTDTQGRKILAQEQPYVPSIVDISDLNRTSFPQSFIFGTASAAYQYEGAAAEGGKGPSIWDAFTHKYPEKIADRSNGDVADDQYHRYKEDIGIMKYMNLDAYRFSISWPRVLPKGKLSGGVNQEGINYYNNLVNELIDNGIQPFVTLFHWDLPQALEDEYQGLLSPLIVNDFRDYADLCFKEFGDRVKHWITFNEPSSVSQQAYSDGTFAPGRCSAWLRRNCTGGNSGTEPYITSHYQLLSHAAAANLYKTKYKESQKGLIGITLNTYWFMPLTDDKSSQDAAQRALDFMFGWYMDPLTKGEYPKSMQTLVGNRLPKFTAEEAQQLKGSLDFLGLNYYSSIYAANALPLPLPGPTLETDPRVILSGNHSPTQYYDIFNDQFFVQRDGKLLGPTAASSWLIIYPKGLEEILLYIKNRYNNTLVYITENGCDEYNNPKLSLNEALVDTYRFDYLYHHLYYLLRAIKDGVNVKGYFHWSLLDNMEWNSGYTVRFGLVLVDYKNGLKRYPKLSGQWFKKFLNKT